MEAESRERRTRKTYVHGAGCCGAAALLGLVGLGWAGWPTLRATWIGPHVLHQKYFAWTLGEVYLSLARLVRELSQNPPCLSSFFFFDQLFIFFLEIEEEARQSASYGRERGRRWPARSG